MTHVWVAIGRQGGVGGGADAREANVRASRARRARGCRARGLVWELLLRISAARSVGMFARARRETLRATSDLEPRECGSVFDFRCENARRAALGRD